MSRKRKGAEVELEQRNASSREINSAGLSRAIENLNSEAGLELPVRTLNTSTYGSDHAKNKCSRLYAVLYFHQHGVLEAAIAAFLQDLANFSTPDEKYERLLKDLTALGLQLKATPRTIRFLGPDRYDEPYEPPPSPTLFTHRHRRIHAQPQYREGEDLTRSFASDTTLVSETNLTTLGSSFLGESFDSSQTSLSTGFEPDRSTPLEDEFDPFYSAPFDPETELPASRLTYPPVNDGATSDISKREIDEAIPKSIKSLAEISPLDPARTNNIPHKVDPNVISSVEADLLEPLLPASFSELPFDVQFEAQRLLQTKQITPELLEERLKQPSLGTVYEIASDCNISFQKSPASYCIDHNDNKDITYSAKLKWRNSSDLDSIFNLALSPPKKDKTCALQRKFGSERVLYVTVPDLQKPPERYDRRKINILVRFRKVFQQPLSFLGRTWHVFLLQSKKPAERSPDAAYRLVLCAGHPGVGILDILHWVLPYHENASQYARKAYSRLELQTSKTTEAVQFEVSDIEFGVEDQKATDDRDDFQFMDPLYPYASYEPAMNDGREMNDGCNVMSLWVAKQCGEALGLESIPTAIQGRIAGAKGVWFVADGHYSKMEKSSSKTHIRLGKSQVKVHRHTLENCDNSILTLNVNKANSNPRPSVLHTGFWPILVNRGVPKESLHRIARAQVDSYVQDYLQALQQSDGVHLRQWFGSHNSGLEDFRRDNEITLLADFPKPIEEQINCMLEVGFDPTLYQPLAQKVERISEKIFNMEKHRFKIKLPRSTTLIGIADPLGCLEPGEIQVVFRDSFTDPESGFSWQILHDMNGLVARNPALAPWDIQKVRFVFKPELEHLKNLVIFSSKGKRPLASKLQGGDYDGDTFWVCWEDDLVLPFKNAPAPWTVPEFHELGISKDKKLLSDSTYVKDPDSEDQWRRWLVEMAMVRLQPASLGRVTKHHEKLIYSEGDINSEEALKLVYLHDYLVDAEKQGYELDDDGVNKFLKENKIPQSLPNPRYWSLPSLEEGAKTYEHSKLPVASGNIIDEIYFDIICPAMRSALKSANEISSSAAPSDRHLTKFYDDTFDHSEPGSMIRSELKGLRDSLEELRDLWKTRVGSKDYKREWDHAILQCRAKYDAIQPADVFHPTAVEWLRQQGDSLTTWGKLKASAFAKFHFDTRTAGSLIFAVAGRELCILKAHESGRTHVIREIFYNRMKLRKAKRVLLPSEEVYDSDEYGVGDELFDESAGDI